MDITADVRGVPLLMLMGIVEPVSYVIRNG